MKEITATTIEANTKLPIQNIMNIYKDIKDQGADVYFIQRQNMISATKLSKLISFMLTADDKAPIKMVIQSPQADKLRNKLKAKFENSSLMVEA